jgi:hypothetical protein
MALQFLMKTAEPLCKTEDDLISMLCPEVPRHLAPSLCLLRLLIGVCVCVCVCVVAGAAHWRSRFIGGVP